MSILPKFKSSIEIEKHETGMEGFDLISSGGLPKGRTTLISGTAGSSKTIFAVQFLTEGIRKSNESGVFVTFEETPDEICKNMNGFKWDINKWKSQNKWAFVDATSPSDGIDDVYTKNYDLGALLARIEYAVKKVNAKRISMDSIGTIFSQLPDASIIRRELHRISTALKKMGITSILTSERVHEYGEIARYGVEEFVADNVIVLRNVLSDEKRRRTIEILKYRGAFHQKGEFPFTIVPGDGINVIPLSAMQLNQKSSYIRISSGNKELDNMCGGGFFRDSIILISGATGTGKTLSVTHFLAGGDKNKEKCLYFAFEESREQLFRNAWGWGIDFEKMEKEERLKIICEYPEVAGLEDHLIEMKKQIADFKPNRVAVDSLSALERVSSIKSFRDFVISLTCFIKQQEVAGFFTSTTPTLLGGTSITETHISTITDSIILLRYVEAYGEMRRGLTVLKMRGSAHDKDIREFSIDGKGMHIGNTFKNISGILSGNPTYIAKNEIESIGSLFRGEAQ